MKTGIFIAVLLHVAILLFGGLIFGAHGEEKPKTTIFEIDTEAVEEKKPEEQKPQEEEPKEEPIEAAPDAPPSAFVPVERPVSGPPQLQEMDFGHMQDILSGGGMGADFGQSGSITSRGIIGGDPNARSGAGESDDPFSAAEIDQKPRATFQAAPLFPAELRGKNMDGVVVVIFIVTADGRVESQRAESSNHPAFEKPALEAIRQWRFEPGQRAGQRIATRMRVTMRFQRS